MEIFISTGEVSGDLQGALLVEALKRQAMALNLELKITALGGDRMESAGATLIGNTTKIASIGLWESLPFIIPTWQIQRKAKEYLRQNPPDVLVLIDYPGPNLSIGEFVRQNFPKIPIIYYIAPQLWVWSPPVNESQRIVDLTDYILTIFPQEAEYFEKKGANVIWVGHPILDRMKNAPTRNKARELLGIKPDQQIITLLPASRRQEVKYLLALIAESARIIQDKLPEVEFLVPLSLSNYRDVINQAISDYGLNARIIEGQSLEAIAASDLAITKSGTVNLEIALLNVPQVVVYRVSRLTIGIARKLFNFEISFISPVNLAAMRLIVPELLQETATTENIVQEALDLLLNSAKRQQVLLDYQEMRTNLGKIDVCDRAATKILELSRKL